MSRPQATEASVGPVLADARQPIPPTTHSDDPRGIVPQLPLSCPGLTLGGCSCAICYGPVCPQGDADLELARLAAVLTYVEQQLARLELGLPVPGATHAACGVCGAARVLELVARCALCGASR